MPHGKSSIIFCFDEAIALVSSDDLPFLCLRRALRRQKKLNKEENIFGVFLERSGTAVAFDLAFPARSNSSTKKAREDGDTGGYVHLACGLDENIYPGYNNQIDYQGDFSMRRN
jgi:hypothetical protein